MSVWIFDITYLWHELAVLLKVILSLTLKSLTEVLVLADLFVIIQLHKLIIR